MLTLNNGNRIYSAEECGVKYLIEIINKVKIYRHAETREYHREGDLPAVEGTRFGPRHKWNILQVYWVHGQKHRTTGPAVIFENGTREWYYHGTRIKVRTQQQFEKWLKLRLF